MARSGKKHFSPPSPDALNLLAPESEAGISTESQMQQLSELVQIGVALSAEKNLDRLLEMIVEQAQRITNAEGATLYIRNEEKATLEFAIVRNDALHIRMGGTERPLEWSPVPLRDERGVENHHNVSAYCALVGKVVNIADVYQAEGFDFSGTREFDRKTGFRSRSMLMVPMRDHDDEVIGVLQLLNARNRLTGEVIEFPRYQVEIVTSLASQAAIGITKMRLVRDLENLLNSFIKAIADAIDEKSPYTADHILRVAELTERLAAEVNRTTTGALAEVRFNDEQLSELRMAAWMHDVGKITTPEHVVDKATKLEAVFDRIELVRYRIELLKKEQELRELRRELGREPDGGEDLLSAEELDGHLVFLEGVNSGSEFLNDQAVKRIEELARLTVGVNGRRIPLLDRNEAANLSVRKGTLTSEERAVIENHVKLTIKILEGLPFPRKMRQVPRIAGMHHEKLDGSGYPHGLKGADIPVQAKILTVADIFEALTAADRPYKRGKRLSESMRILEEMANRGEVDRHVCDLLVESGLVTEYASRALASRQQDHFTWRGRVYRMPQKA